MICMCPCVPITYYEGAKALKHISSHIDFSSICKPCVFSLSYQIPLAKPYRFLSLVTKDKTSLHIQLLKLKG